MIPFDPNIHDENVPLFEIKSLREADGVIATIVVPAEVEYKFATRTPWYYMVEEGRNGES
jgi:hypothetical protein